MRSVFAMLIALALAIADPALAALAAADARVADVAWRLQTANVELCHDVRRLPGFTIQSLGQYPPAQRAAVAAAYQLGDQPGVAAVARGSSAAQVGLAIGDTVVAINGQPTPALVPARASYDVTAAMQAMLAAGLAQGPIALTIARAGSMREIVVPGDRGCASDVEIAPERALNARADGRYVQVSGTLVGFAASDDELAFVVAHELAHNVLGHRRHLDAAGIARHGRLAGAGRNGATLRDVELDADRLGVWLVARAGYALDAPVAMWTRLRAATACADDGTHPGWETRIAHVAQAVAQVRAQQAAGLPLIPPALSLAVTPPQQTAFPTPNPR